MNKWDQTSAKARDFSKHGAFSLLSLNINGMVANRVIECVCMPVWDQVWVQVRVQVGQQAMHQAIPLHIWVNDE